MFSRSVAAVLVAGVFHLAAVRAQAQEMPPIDLTGTVHGVAPDALQVLNTANEPYLVGWNPETVKLTITGTAEVAYLRPGVWVRFNAEVDRKGLIEQPVAELTIFTPNDIARPGLFLDSGPGEEPDPNAAALPYLVSGRLGAIKRGTYQANCAGKTVKFTLAENIVVNVDVLDLSVVSQGDQITVHGVLVQPGAVLADKITITLANPLTPPQRGRRRPQPESSEEEPPK